MLHLKRDKALSAQMLQPVFEVVLAVNRAL
jgi:hypothetical protein